MKMIGSRLKSKSGFFHPVYRENKKLKKHNKTKKQNKNKQTTKIKIYNIISYNIIQHFTVSIYLGICMV